MEHLFRHIFSYKIGCFLLTFSFACVNVLGQKSAFLGWVNSFDQGYTQGYSIAIDSYGNVYNVGISLQAGGSFTFNTTTGIDSIVPTGSPCSIIQKVNAEGETVWVKELESSYGVVANDVAIDQNDNLVITGYYQDSTDFDPGSNQVIDTASTIMIFVVKLDQQGEFVWVKTFKNSSGSSKGTSIAVDDNNNIVFAGTFSGTVDFDPSPGISELTSLGSTDVFICKIDENGNLIWVKSNEGPQEDVCQSMTIDNNQNILLIGNFKSTVDFDPGPGIHNETDTSLEVGGIVFVQKLDINGNFKWVNVMSGSNFEFGEDITTDMDGNVYSLGRYNENIDVDPSSNNLIFNSLGSQDVFIQKVDSLGNFIWGKSFGGIAYDYGRSLSVSNDGNLYICGYYKIGIDLDPGPDSCIVTAEAEYDAFLLKLDTAGSFKWGASYHGSWYEHPARMVLDNQNNVYLVGFFEGICDFDPTGMNSHEVQTAGRTSYVVKFEEGYVGIENRPNESPFSLYPNPANDYIILEPKVPSDCTVQMVDMQGRILFEQNLEGDGQNKLDVSAIPQGLYILQFVQMSTIVYSTKLILEH